MELNRAYSILTIKAVDRERRYIAGIATTPEPDRHGDIVEASGVSFRSSIPLLLYHDKTQPVGTASLKAATADGVPFEASLPFVAEPGKLRDRVDEAWHSIKAGLLMGISIGFRVVNDAVEQLKSGGLRFRQIEVVELSLVTIPANASASIHTIKSLYQTGVSAHNPTAVAVPSFGKTPMTIQEQIKQFSDSRAPLVARMSELMAKASESGATLEEADAKEYDGIDTKVKGIDQHLSRLRNLEAANVAAATPITGTGQENGTAQRGGMITVRPNIPKGTAFVRYAMALLRAKGDSMRALEYAKSWKESTPEVEWMVKAAVAPGDTVTPAWAGVLVQIQNATNEFLELLRPATIIGKIPNLRKVPFNTQVPLQTGGGTYGWVGQGAPKPVTKMALTTTAIQFSKAAGIIVITDELAKLSSPSAEDIVRNEMIAGISQFLDAQFIDPAVAVVANVSPASITNGAPTAASQDDASKDLSTILGAFSAANYPLGSITLIMSEKNALAMGMKRDAMGNKIFPSMGVAGGSAEGINVVASNAAGLNVIGVSGPNILFADEGGIAIDVSREASLQMADNPMNPADATTVFTSLWQNNLVGLRAERMINWQRARTTAVYYLTDAVYTV